MEREIENETATQEPEVQGDFQDIPEPQEQSEFQPEQEDKEQVDEDPVEETQASTEEKKPEEKQDESDPKIDALIDRAHDLGLSDKDIGEFDSTEALEKALTVYERRLMASLRQPEPPPPIQQQAATQQARVPVELPDLDPKEFDEGLVKAWGSMKEMVRYLNDQNQQLVNHIRAEQGRAEDARFDDHIAKLGDQYKEIFGAGSVSELDPKSTEFKNRAEVYRAMHSLKLGYQQLGTRLPSEGELFKRAVNSVFGDKILSKTAATERQKIAATLKKRSKQHIGRATHREGIDSRTGEQRAIDAVRAKLRDRGHSVQAEPEEF